MADISGATLAEYNIPMRSSVLGMKSLQRILEASDNPLAIKKIKIQDNYVNANAQIAAAKLKAMGIKLIFHKDDDEVHEIEKDVIMPIHIGGYTIYDSPINKPVYNRLFDEYRKYLNACTIVEGYPGEKQDIAWKHVFEMDEFKDSSVITQDVKDMLLSVTKRRHITKMMNDDVITEEEYNEYLPELKVPTECEEES